MEQDKAKVYTIYAGINGAGKSTIYEAKKRPNENRVNPDEIAKYHDRNWTLYSKNCEWFNRIMNKC